MMLTLSVFYSIPEFDVSTLFLLSCGSGVNGHLGNGGNLPTIRASGASSIGDPERIHLQSSGGARYSQQINDSETMSGSGVSSFCIKIPNIAFQWLWFYLFTYMFVFFSHWSRSTDSILEESSGQDQDQMKIHLMRTNNRFQGQVVDLDFVN